MYSSTSPVMATSALRLGEKVSLTALAPEWSYADGKFISVLTKYGVM